MITNLLINPYDYYFEPQVEAGYLNGDSIEVDIPLYKDGEVRLMMKNAEYSTELPTFIVDIEYSLSQSEND